ncbi:MAG: PilZ domain-containing protein [Thermodesulfobacteriota bacterium]
MADDKKKDFIERRKHKRYKVKKGSCQVDSKTESKSQKAGEIIDISMGGLAFSYLEDGEWTDESFDQGMLLGEKDLCVEDLPLKVISDCAINTGITITRRCGMQFGKLTPKQISQLEYYIWTNTDAEEEENDLYLEREKDSS